jgi:hypothetical protein
MSDHTIKLILPEDFYQAFHKYSAERFSNVPNMIKVLLYKELKMVPKVKPRRSNKWKTWITDEVVDFCNDNYGPKVAQALINIRSYPEETEDAKKVKATLAAPHEVGVKFGF